MKQVLTSISCLLVLALTVQAAAGQDLGSFTRPALRVSAKLKNVGLETAVQIQMQSAQLSLKEIFTLSSPERLVVDLEPVGLTSNTTVNLASNPFVKQLRIGVHTDKTRLVFDLLQADYSYNSAASSNSLMITITGRATVPKALEPPAAAAQPSATSAPGDPSPTVQIFSATRRSPSPEPSALPPSPATGAEKETLTKLSAPPSATPSASATPPSTATPSPLPAQSTVDIPAGAQVLQEFSFELMGERAVPVVKFLLAKPTRFTLTKAGPRLYKLTIPGCIVAHDHLLLPRFPPFEFEGYNMVQISRQGGSVVAAIAVDRDTRLKASIHQRELWVELNSEQM